MLRIANSDIAPQKGALGLSVHWKQISGVNPIQFLHFLTLEYTKQKLSESRSLLDTALDAGLSGPGRLHDLFVTFEAMTPGEFKSMGAGLEIEYGWNFTPFGECLLATTRKGICHLSFVENEDRHTAFTELQSAWPNASFREDTQNAGDIVQRLFKTADPEKARPFHLYSRAPTSR